MPASDIQPFDPFSDRLSRDLRNDLSKALIIALEQGTPDPVLETAAGYRETLDPGSARSRYLEERLACYLAVLSELEKDNVTPDRQALALWNHQLFFEFHELLEQRWLKSNGVRKLVLQALIRAAGTYIHRQSGHSGGAAKMAARAREVITRYPRDLPAGFESAPLLAALAEPAAPPPRFGPVGVSSHPCRHSSTG